MTMTNPARGRWGQAPAWAVYCPQCEDELYQFWTPDVAERMADVHADHNRDHHPEVQQHGVTAQ
jgi:hypothetical protein